MEASTFRASRFNLGVKLSIFVIVLVLAVSASMAYFLVYRSAADRRASMETRFKSFARIIGGMRGHGYGGRTYDPMLVKMFVDFGVQLGTHLCYVVFTDAEGKLEGGSLNRELLIEAAPELDSALEGHATAEQLKRVLEWRWTKESVRPFKVKLQGKGDHGVGAADRPVDGGQPGGDGHRLPAGPGGGLVAQPAFRPAHSPGGGGHAGGRRRKPGSDPDGQEQG
jgi:hypothetical protein